MAGAGVLRLARFSMWQAGRRLVGAGDGVRSAGGAHRRIARGRPHRTGVVRVDRPEARSVELSLLVDAGCWSQGFGMDMMQTILEACFAGWESTASAFVSKKAMSALWLSTAALASRRRAASPGCVSGWPAPGRAPTGATCRGMGRPWSRAGSPRITEPDR